MSRPPVSTSSRSSQSSAAPLSARFLLPAFALLILLLGVTWLWHSERRENAELRDELTTLRLAHRAATSRSSLAAGALQRAARLEEALELLRQNTPAAAAAPVAAPAAAPDNSRAEELERVITFLRGEINAAHETIQRLERETPAGPRKRAGAP